MTRKTRSTRSLRPSPALVLSCVALFLALAGSALALPKNTVRSAQIVDATVRTVDLRENAVKAPSIAPDAVTAEEVAENAVASAEVVDESLGAADLGTDSVGASEVGSGSIGSDELATVSVRTASEPIEAGKTGSIAVGCLPGEQVLSGGGQPSHFGVEMTSTRPSGNGWLYQAYNKNGSDSTITVFALCLS